MTQRFLDTTTHSIAWIYKRHQADELELTPPFQRNPVWSDVQKSYLIDSVLKGFPIPEIYMQEFTDSDGNDQYIVVDGQQRLRACIDFLDNAFAMTGKDALDFEGLNFEDLTPDQRQTVYNYNFVVRKLPEMSDNDLRAMFARLNKSVVALNSQELRHSTYSGEFITLMEEVADDDRWGELGIFTPNDIRRMLDVEYISEISIGVLHGPQNKKSTLERWYAAYEADFERRAELRSTFNKVLGEIDAILPGLHTTRWRKKSDFYTLFLVMAEIVGRFPLASEERTGFGDKLTIFGSAIDQFIANPDMEPPPHQYVRHYTSAVERAASDLANRRARATQLRLLLGIPEPGAPVAASSTGAVS